MWNFLKTLIVLALLAGVLGTVVFYNHEIKLFSNRFVNQQAADKATARQDWLEAMHIYEKAHAENPKDLHNIQKLAEVKFRLSQLYADEGSMTYTTSGNDLPKQVTRTVKELRREADSLFRQGIQQDPKSKAIRLAYGKMLQADPSRFAEAVGNYRQVLELHKDDPEVLVAMGDLYKAAAENPRERRVALKNWLYDWAIYYYRSALQLKPGMFQPRFNLAVIYQVRPATTKGDKQENLIKATRQYCNTLIVAPDSYEARYNLGLTLVELNAHDAGFRQLNYAVHLLSEHDRVGLAQQLAQQVQSVRNSVYYDDPQLQLGINDMAPWMKSCLEQFAVGTPGDSSQTTQP